MADDESLSKITRLLERGGTMLADHHDCGAPLFRYKGNVVCPVCSFPEEGGEGRVSGEAKVGGRDEMAPRQTGTKADLSALERDVLSEGTSPSVGAPGSAAVSSPGTSPETSPGTSDVAPLGFPRTAAFAGDRLGVEEDLMRVVLCRLGNITQALEVEGDPGRLRDLLECADAALRVLRSLR